MSLYESLWRIRRLRPWWMEVTEVEMAIVAAVGGTVSDRPRVVHRIKKKNERREGRTVIFHVHQRLVKQMSWWRKRRRREEGGC